MVKRDRLYPVVDMPDICLLRGERNLRARWTGEPPRPIKAGEYYLSGAIIGAYQAFADDVGPYHPAQLVIATPRPLEYDITPFTEGVRP